MKYAIIADIHGNLEALHSVLADIERQNITNIACLGDIVGYYANPKECLDLIRTMNIPCVKGNHDENCAAERPLEEYSPQAIKVIQWTRNQLTDDDRQWLRSLNYTLTVANFTIVHATLDTPEHWGYVFDKIAAAASFPYQRTQICFFGHTHVPVAFVRDTSTRGGTYTTMKIDLAKKYLVNPGSVGQPRDNSKATYAVYDTAASTIELRRIEYDFATTQRKIREAGL